MDRGTSRDEGSPDIEGDEPSEPGAIASASGNHTVERTRGVGLTMMVLTAVLLTFAYYGAFVVSIRGFGEFIPTPFYLLALAVVFVVELVRRGTLEAFSLAQAMGVTAVFGTLIVLALEGGAFLWVHPEVGLDNFAIVAVFAVSLVLAALAYVLVLTLRVRF